MARGQRGLQLETTGIRVARQLGQLPLDGGQRPGTRTEGILVRGQLDDIPDPELPLELADGLAGLIGLETANARHGKR